MTDDGRTSTTIERFPTGIAGLDTILQGGLYRGTVYLFLAKPGTGKTILGNQLCFSHVAAGGRAVVVTLLTESHSRLIAHLRPFAFFDPASVGAGLSYVTGYQALESGKLKGLLSLLRQVVRDQKATLLVLDGFVTAGAMSESELDVKKFVHELQSFVELIGCTTILLTGASDAGVQYAVRTMVDGLVELHVDSAGMAAVRSLEVTKSRGSAALMGRHPFEITDAGVTVFPRMESHVGKLVSRDDSLVGAPVAEFGIAGLDAMFGGGVRRGSLTLVLGAPASGKTLVGLNLLAEGARQSERGLYFGFFEAAVDLRERARATGLDLSDFEAAGLIDMMWQSPVDAIADALAVRLVTTLRERGIRRLVIDGLGGFKDSLVFAERWGRFFLALSHELRAMGVVTILTDETRTLGEFEIPGHGLTAMLDNILCLRHVEVRTGIRRVLSIIKQRDGVGDTSPHAFSIDARGIVVSPAHGARATGGSRKGAKATKGRRGPSGR